LKTHYAGTVSSDTSDISYSYNSEDPDLQLSFDLAQGSMRSVPVVFHVRATRGRRRELAAALRLLAKGLERDVPEAER